MMRPALTEKQRRHRKATSDAMKRLAATRQCPACERKMALSVHVVGTTIAVKQCRYCGWQKERVLRWA